ncbi:MAG: TolC family protein [Nitrospiraceae bacterium]|nr:TolC family protein [Nitrospiraceae bacterium]
MKKPLLLPLAALLLAGCATFHNRPLDPLKTARQFEARSLQSGGLERFIEKNLKRKVSPWPPGTWDLKMLTLAAFYYNPEMDVARAKWLASQARIITAGGLPNPAARFIPQYHANPMGLPPWTLTFDLAIPIETAGRRGYRIARARHLSRAVEMQMAMTAWNVRSRLRRDLLSFYGASQKETLLAAQRKLLEEIVGLYESRLAEGFVSRFALTSSTVALDKTIFAQSEAKKEEALAKARLAGALGLPDGALKGTDISFAGFKEVNASLYRPYMRRQALLGRADIHAGLEQYAAAQSSLQLEIAKQYPDLNLGPGYAWDQGDNEWSLGVFLTLPVLNQNRGPVAEARARRRQARDEFISLQDRVIRDMDVAFAGYKESLDGLRAAGSLLKGLSRNLKAVQARFKMGDASSLDVDEARRELILARLSRLDALIAAQQSVGQLEDALQRPLNNFDSFPQKAAAEDGMQR